jgi:hypothetical protein
MVGDIETPFTVIKTDIGIQTYKEEIVNGKPLYFNY